MSRRYEKMNTEESNLQTECQHNFCEACLKVWLEKSDTCPFIECRGWKYNYY